MMPFWAVAQEQTTPPISPKAKYIDKKGETVETTSIDEGEAPLEVTFCANPHELDDRNPQYEWHFQRQGEETEMMVRYEECTTYRFVDSGTYTVTLKVTFADDGSEETGTPITVVILESKLEFPNAFSPNDDGWNDKFKAKEGYRSIVEFKGYIFNRWGQKLYEWDDPSGEWDGRYRGNYVKDGVYFLLVKAKGADGHVYNIRQDINVLSGTSRDANSGSGSGKTP